MNETQTKKFPLLFSINEETGEVHTARQREKGGPFFTECGQSQADEDLEYTSEPTQITCGKCLALYQKRFVWTVEITVHPTWVQDGFDLTEDRLNDMLGSELSCANSDEYGGKIISAPDADEVAMEMGYKSAAEKAFRDKHGYTTEYKGD